MAYCNSTYPAEKLAGVHLGPDSRPLLVDGFNIATLYEKDDTSHYVAVNKQERSVLLVFRGSTNTNNFVSSADSRRVIPESEYFGEASKDVRVFAGFQRVAISQLKAAADALEKEYKNNPNLSVVIAGRLYKMALAMMHVLSSIPIGHSLGGALAHLAAVHIKQKRQILVSFVYTYGEPIIGNVAFGD
jgi:predicted lipase